MYRNNNKLGIKSIIIAALMLFFCFERNIVAINPYLSYVDELFAIVVILELSFKLLGKRLLFLDSNEKKVLFCLIILTLIGIFGNIVGGVLTQPFPICVDIISTCKIFLGYYWIRMQNLKPNEIRLLLVKTGTFIQVIIVIMFVFYFVANYMNYDMFLGARYGIKSYRFIFDSPGNFSKFFYFAIPLLTTRLYFKNTKKDKYILLLALIVWCLTLRSRAIAFSVCFIIFAFYYFVILKNSTKRISIINIIPLVIIALIIGYEQIQFYFTNENQPRGILLKYSFITASRYLPLGSGFGTFGSDIAKEYYSPLYSEYGFTRFYGMGHINSDMLNDNYWPMIIGQFGIIGLVIMILILYYFHKSVFQAVQKNRVFCFSAICAVAFLLASSIASKSYCEFTSLPVFMFIGLLVQYNRKTTNNKGDV